MQPELNFISVIISGRCWLCSISGDPDRLTRRGEWMDCATCGRSYSGAGDVLRERIPMDDEWKGKLASVGLPVLFELSDGTVVRIVDAETGRHDVRVPVDAVAWIVVWPD